MNRQTRTFVAVLATAATAAVLAGCTAEPESKISSGKDPSTDVLEMPADSIDKAVEKLPDQIKSILAKSKVPGLAVAVVHGGKTVFAEGYGVKKKGEPGKIDADTVFQIASVSKSIGATVVASEVSKGVVAWDTPAVEHLPGFSLSDPWVTEHATIGDFYSHRSGLPFAAGDSLEDIGYDRDYILSHLKYEPLNSFRDSYAYANFGITVGAQAVANAAGTDWATLSEKELYEPLGMTSTSSRYSDFLKRKDRAAMHAKVDGTFKPLYQRNAEPQSPAGGVSSNVTDLAKWMQLILGQGKFKGKQLIDPAALLPATSPEMFKTHSSSVLQRPQMYGFGFGVGVQPSGRVVLSHSGAFVQGAGTVFQILPSADVGIIVLTNGGPVGVAEAVASQFMDQVQFGHSTRDWYKAFAGAMAPGSAAVGDLLGKKPPATPAAAGPLSSYVGEYHNDFYGTAVVSEDGDHLAVAMGPDGGYTFSLEHWSGDEFSFVPTGENAPQGSLSSAKFAVGADGATTLTLDFFNADKLGVWTR